MIAILLAVIFANVHKKIVVDNEEFREAALDYETSSWIINKLPLIVLVVFLLIVVVLWTKPDLIGGGGQV